MAQLTQLQKAVLVMVSMAEDQAITIIKKLTSREIKMMSAEVKNITKVSAEEVMEVMEEFLQEVTGGSGFLSSGEEWMRSVIEKALGSNKASHILKGMGAPARVFDSLFDVDANSLANMIRKEHLQTQAVILAHLDPAKAAAVLPLLPEDDQVEVVLRMAKIANIHPDLIRDIEDALMEEIQMMGTITTTEAGGVDMVVDMLNIMEKKHEKAILSGMEQEDPKLAEEIKSLMFVFEDLVNIDNRSLQMVMREVDSSTLVLALKGANEDMRERIYQNVSMRASQMLKEDIDALGPVRLSEVERAQSEVVRIALRLEEEGKIVISGGSEEEFV